MAVFLFTVLSPVLCSSAPSGNLGNPFLWKNGIFSGAGPNGYVVALEYYKQKNEFAYQRDRFPWYDPNLSPPEERHKIISRSSINDFNSSGIKAGVTFGSNVFLYCNLGAMESKIDFMFTDETTLLDGGGSSYYEVEEHFSSDSDFYYGLGVSAIMHDTINNGIPIKSGVDLKYKNFGMSADNTLTMEIPTTTTMKTSYETELHEVQLSFLTSFQFKPISPYGGLRLSCFFGDETYINDQADKYYTKNIYYKNSIDWQTYLGFVAGVTIPVKEWFSIDVEAQFGDEEGYFFSCLAKF